MKIISKDKVKALIRSSEQFVGNIQISKDDFVEALESIEILRAKLLVAETYGPEAETLENLAIYQKKVEQLRVQVISLRVQVETDAIEKMNDLRDMEIRVLRAYRDELKQKLSKAALIIKSRVVDLGGEEKEFLNTLGGFQL